MQANDLAELLRHQSQILVEEIPLILMKHKILVVYERVVVTLSRKFAG